MFFFPEFKGKTSDMTEIKMDNVSSLYKEEDKISWIGVYP